MYEQFWNQLYHLLHFGVAYTLLLFLWPKLLITKFSEDRLEQTIANYLLMAFLLLSLSMILIALHLYEFLSLTAILILLTYHKYISGRKSHENSDQPNKLMTWIYDYFEGFFQLRHIVADSVIKKQQQLQNNLKTRVKVSHAFLFFALTVLVFGVSAYIRWYDAVHSPVPNMSDGWVVLKWIKSAEFQTLYPDGIYPAGYQVFLATIRKYADIDPIYLVKYVGPLNMMFIMVGYYFVVTRFTFNKAAGIISIIVYGILSPLFFASSYERQASSMSQEFAMAFVLVCLYFFVQYVRTGKKQSLWAATAGTSTVGIVHSVPYIWIGLGMGIIIFLHTLMMRRQDIGKSVHLIIAGIVTIVAAATPIALAYLFRVQVYQGITDFVDSKTVFQPPDLRAMDYIALLSVALIVIYVFFKKVNNKLDRFPELFVALFVVVTFLVYYYGGYTQRAVITVRSKDLWFTAIPLAVGMGSHALFRMLLGGFRIRQHLELAVASAVLIISVWLVPPKPIFPYKLESKTTVEQYMRITKLYLPQTYLIVSPRAQMFPLVFGKGSHMYLVAGSPSLINEYDPTKAPLTKYGETKHADVAADIFIFYEKNIFQVKQSEEIYDLEGPKYTRYAREYAMLQSWLQTFKASNPKAFSVFYEDSNLIIYHLHREESAEDRRNEVKKIWS